MATATFTAHCPACQREIYGYCRGAKRRDAEAKAQWVIENPQPCAPCVRIKRRAAAKAARDAEVAVAVAANHAAGLPRMVGTATKVARAEVIRAKAMASRRNRIKVPPVLDQAAADKLGIALDARRWSKVYEACVAARTELETEDDARFWVEHEGELDDWTLRTCRAAVAHQQRLANAAAKRAGKRAATAPPGERTP